VTTRYAILTALAAGHVTAAKIAVALATGRREVTYVLQLMMDDGDIGCTFSYKGKGGTRVFTYYVIQQPKEWDND
jgi:hypothetical protein